MAQKVIRESSFPLSSYDVLSIEQFAKLPSGYRGLIVDPGYITKDLTLESIDISAPLVKYRPDKETPTLVLKIPILSAAMQAISGYRMGIALARIGGLAVIYQSQPIDQQAEQVRSVKMHKGAFIEPKVLPPDAILSYVAERMKATGYSKFFITENGEQHGKFLGIITDEDFDETIHGNLFVKDRMQTPDNIDIEYDEIIGYDVKKANERILQGHHDVLCILYKDGSLRDVLFRKDIKTHREYKDELIDNKKRLMVAAAVNTRDYEDRVPELVKAGTDVLVIDTSQGWTEFVKETAQYIRNKYEHIPLVGGNVVNKEGFRFLVEGCDVHAVKVGMGIGSICITPLQKGVASGQDRAIEETVHARDEYYKKTGIYVPIIADGGIRSVRDKLVALAFGADSLMLGYFLAGVDETPTEVFYTRSGPKKPYWGEASRRAQGWREQRGYNIQFEEGIDGEADYVGPLDKYLAKALIQLKEGIRGAGCRNIQDLHKFAVIKTISEKDASAEQKLMRK